MANPIANGVLTSGFTASHPAIDIGWLSLKINDPPIMAWRSGRITESRYDSKTGNTVSILHPLNTDYAFVSRYMHLKTRAVKLGQDVKEAQTIGVGGSTGSLSTGPHLHFELWLIPNGITAYTVKNRSLYAFDPRTILSTTMKGAEMHMIITTPSTMPTVVTASSILNYRIAPSLKAKILGQLAKEKAYPMTGTVMDDKGITWAQIIVDSIVAYSSLEYLIVNDPKIERPIHTVLTDGKLRVQVDYE